MSRTAQSSKKYYLVTLLVVLLLGLGVYVDQINHNSTSVTSTTGTQAVSPQTYLTYQGESGKNALELLKSHAKVVTKSSSIGDYVISINGSDGGGKKYWIFYINGSEAQVGAGAYTTQSGDKIEWKLQ